MQLTGVLAEIWRAANRAFERVDPMRQVWVIESRDLVLSTSVWEFYATDESQRIAQARVDDWNEKHRDRARSMEFRVVKYVPAPESDK
jgi:hypothetical protein